MGCGTRNRRYHNAEDKIIVDALSQFLDAVYGADDNVRVSTGGGQNFGIRGRDVLDHVRKLDAAGIANIYLGVAAYGVRRVPTWDAPATVSARAFFLDIDYGTVGHHGKTPFTTAPEALSYIRSLPVPPHVIWHTGHGFQAAYFLDVPLDLRTATARDTYCAIASRLCSMALADPRGNPASLLRVPGTVNAKPGCPPIRGAFVDIDRIDQRISLADLQAFVGTVAAATTEDTEADSGDPEITDAMSGTETVGFDQLSADLQAFIRDDHDDRSAAMFSAIARIVREARGIAPASVVACIRAGPAFRDKYGSRLAKEVRRCLHKVEIADDAEDITTALDIKPATDIALNTCTALPKTLEATVRAAVAVRHISEPGHILDTATYMHEVVATHRKAIVEAPCGSGKTTAAICIAIDRARAGKRTVMVVETVEALCTLYAEIQALAAAASTPISIGVHHGFRPELCRTLTGIGRTWRQCILRDPESVCHSCEARSHCSYYCRDRALKDVQIVIMPHAGFITMLERKGNPFRDRLVIVDEDPKVFCGLDLSLEELDLAGRYLREDDGITALAPLFPGCGFHLQSIPGYPVERGAVYATRNFVAYAGDDITLTRKVLHRIRGRLFADPDKRSYPPEDYMRPAEIERAEDVLLKIIQFFRGKDLDAKFVCHIQYLATSWTLKLRKRRIGPQGFPEGLNLFILNASAGCSRLRTSENMPVCRCPDLVWPATSLRLTVISGNPMQSRIEANVSSGLEALKFLPWRPRNVLVVTAVTDDPTDYGDRIRHVFPEVTVMHLTRGRTRGTNAARTCDLLFLAGLALFTSIPEAAMAAALDLGQTVRAGDLIDDTGKPAMSAGAFRFAPLQREYMRSALDELYQTLYRGCLRDGLPMDAVIVLPHASWLSGLWDLGLAGFQFRRALPGSGRHGRRLAAFDGLWRILKAPPGTELEKSIVAADFGFPTWKAAKRTVMPLLVRHVTAADRVVIRNTRSAIAVETVELF